MLKFQWMFLAIEIKNATWLVLTLNVNTGDHQQGSGSCKHGHNISGGLSPAGVKHSHSMRDQTSHMREKYQARYQHRRLSIRTPTASNNNTPKVVGGTNIRGNLPGWLVKVRNLRKKNVQIWCFLGNLAGFYVSIFFIFICGSQTDILPTLLLEVDFHFYNCFPNILGWVFSLISSTVRIVILK